jgi:hypothetical protein
MFGRRRTITCPAGVWTTVLRTPFAQLPVKWTLRLVAERGAVAGQFEENKSTWVFPGTPRTGPLQPEMVFERGYWNTFYTLRVRPVDTVTVTIE